MVSWRNATSAPRTLGKHTRLKENKDEVQRVIGVLCHPSVIYVQEKLVYVDMNWPTVVFVAEYKKLVGITADTGFRWERAPEFPEGFTSLRRYEGTKGKM